MARRLTPMFVGSGESPSESTAVSAELVDLLGIGDIRDLDLDVTWRPRLQRDRLRVPIGLTDQGQPIALDIKESGVLRAGGVGGLGGDNKDRIVSLTTDEATAFAVLDRYVEAGGTFVDTSNNYAFWTTGSQGGESEAVLARSHQPVLVVPAQVSEEPAPITS